MDSDDEIDATSSWKGVPATIICINTFDRRSKTAEIALEASCRMLRQSLRISGSNFVGVCLYGTEVKNSSILGINSVEEVFPLKQPTIDDYRNLQKVSVTSLNQAQDLILSEVLWYCSRMFSSCKRQLSFRKIILLSRLDIPPVPSDQKPALKRVVELADSNIDIKLINISEKDYAIDSFYTNFLIEANKKEEIILPKPIWNIKDIEQLIQQHSHRHLAVARLNFEISESVAIGVGVYSLIKSQGQWKKTDLHRDDNTILTKVNKTMKVAVKDDTEMDVDEDSEESKPVPLLKSELLHYKIVGGEKVQFTDDEMKTMKNPFGPPMLKLLGFKPASAICKEKWYLKSCYFLFPSEEIIEGSTVAFKSLYRACVKTNKVAICVLCTRVNARPIIVALSPSSAPFGLDVEIGFDIIRIPFVENIRQLPNVHEEDDEVIISNASKSVVRDILGQLSFDYRPDMFENPKIQSQYRAIEAIALDEDNDSEEPFVDTTKPDSKQFEGLQDELFQEIFGPFGPIAVKKTASSREGGPASKKQKQEIDESLLQTRLSNQKIKDYTVAQLKDILYSREIQNLPALTGLKKNDLVDLVYKHCKS